MLDSDGFEDVGRYLLGKSERAYVWWFGAAAVVEAIMLVAFLLVMDFHDRLHWLILIAAFLVYGTLTLVVIALGAYMRHCIFRVLRALELQRNPTFGEDGAPAIMKE